MHHDCPGICICEGCLIHRSSCVKLLFVLNQCLLNVQVHTYEELTNSFRDVSSKCHSLISDGGKEITKLLSSSNRTLKVSKGAPAWKAYVDYIGDIVIDGLVECIIASVHRLTSQASPCLIALAAP